MNPSLEDISIQKLRVTQAIDQLMEVYNQLDKWEENKADELNEVQRCADCNGVLEKKRVQKVLGGWKCLKCQGRANSVL